MHQNVCLLNTNLSLYILSNKSNAPNKKLNHRFIFTLTDYMSVYVRYEYDKMFESTTKKCVHWTMTWFIGDCNSAIKYRERVLNGCKNTNFLAFVKPNIPPHRKKRKRFLESGWLMSLFYRQKWDIVSFILTNDKREHCRVRMRNIMPKAVLMSVKCWLQTVPCILKTFIKRQCPKLCFEFGSGCDMRMRNIKW